MNYQETLDWLFAQLPMYQLQGAIAYKKDLTNTIILANHLGNPEKYIKTIHVAGTNGKGSTSSMLASVLQEAGYKVGLYTSPHLKDFRERIKINGIEISKEFVVDFVAQNKTFFEENGDFNWNVFSNISITDSEYLKSEIASVKGNKVEFVPLFNIKTGTGIGYKNFITSLQFTYLSSQFSSANLADRNNVNNGVSGQIPAYYVADFSASYKFKYFKLESGITNFTNNSYFTRRATGYPGPGIIPSDSRTFYITLEFTY